MKNLTHKDLCNFLGTYCAMYHCIPYYVGRRDPFPIDTEQIFSGLKYDDLTVGRIVNMYVTGRDMKFDASYKSSFEYKFEQSEIFRIAKNDDMKIMLFAPHYLDNARMTSSIDFGEEYKKALDHEKLFKVKRMHELIPKAADETGRWFKNDTKKLAKELGMQEHMSDKRLRAALSMAASEIMEKYSFPLWEGEAPQFMMSCESYDEIIKELYELTYEKLQMMQVMEQSQDQVLANQDNHVIDPEFVGPGDSIEEEHDLSDRSI